MHRSKRHTPGDALELEVEQFLRSAGFRTQRNAGAARPRQTDIYAQADDFDILVEVKDRKRSVDINDVDALRSRLGRTAADIVGVIFTTSAITKGAVKAIEADRTREILIFVSDEIRLLRRGRANALTLIQRKRNELRVRGRAWFGPLVAAGYVDVQLPRSSFEFQHQGHGSYFASPTSHADFLYAMEVPDLGWGISNGDGVSLRLDLTLNTMDDLRNMLGYLHEEFGLTTKGTFSIHQSECSWHGCGAKEFVNTVRDWRKRYRDAQFKYVHHSEDIVYVDRLRDGWVVLSTRQRVPRPSDLDDQAPHFHSSELAIALPGIPLNAKPFLELCRYTGNEWGEFQYVAERHCKTMQLEKSLKLKVVGTVAENFSKHEGVPGDRRPIVAVLAKNPFYRKRTLPKELSHDPALLHDLVSTELLLCDLKDWHDEGDVIDAYLLQGFETTFVYRAQLVRPFGTWRRIMKRVRRQNDRDAQRRAFDYLRRRARKLDSRFRQGHGE